jgi:hypothetical protein
MFDTLNKKALYMQGFFIFTKIVKTVMAAKIYKRTLVFIPDG